jgi:hypothetical protein
VQHALIEKQCEDYKKTFSVGNPTLTRLAEQPHGVCSRRIQVAAASGLAARHILYVTVQNQLVESVSGALGAFTGDLSQQFHVELSAQCKSTDRHVSKCVSIASGEQTHP